MIRFKRTTILISLLLLALVALALTLPGSTEAKTITVDQGGEGDYETIQEAIDAADEGDRILVRPGDYHECLELKKSLEIVGDGPESTVVYNDRDDHGITIRADGVRLEGLSFECKEGFDHGINAISSNSSFVNCHIRDYFEGIRLHDSQNTRLENVNVTGSMATGVVFATSQNCSLIESYCSENAYGLGLLDTSNTSVLRNRFYKDTLGIQFTRSRNTLFQFNDVNETEANALGINEGEQITLRNNSFWKSIMPLDSITIRNSQGLVFEGNRIHQQGGYAMIIQSSPGLILKKNIITDCERGIKFEANSDSLIQGNTITGNGDHGIFMKSSLNSTIWENSIQNNTGSGIYLESSLNSTIWKNTIQDNTGSGIYLESSLNSTIRESTIQDNKDSGIALLGCDSPLVQNNNIRVPRQQSSIVLSSVTGAELQGNTMVDGGLSFGGSELEHWNSHQITVTNTFNAGSIQYVLGQEGGELSPGGSQYILVECSDLELSGGSFHQGSTPIVVAFSQDLSIRNNLCSDGRFGIYVQGSKNILLSKNRCENNIISGVYLSDSESCRLEENYCNDNEDDGIDLRYGGNHLILKNRCYSNGDDGISFMGGESSDPCEFIRNICRDNGDSGIAVKWSNDNLMTSNVLTGNGKAGAYIYSSDRTTLIYNLLRENLVGIFLEDASKGNDAYYNDIYQSTVYGIDCQGDCEIELMQNWWGVASGPYHWNLNPDGDGDELSDNVDLGTWSSDSQALPVPSCAIRKISPEDPHQYQEVRFSGNHESEREIVQEVWHSDIDGELFNGSALGEFRTWNLSLGNHTISYRVMNEFYHWSPVAISFLNVEEFQGQGRWSPSDVGMSFNGGEGSQIQILESGKNDSVQMRLGFRNWNYETQVDRVFLLYREIGAKKGTKTQWELEFLNPTGGRNMSFFESGGKRFFRYVRFTGGSVTKIELQVSHSYPAGPESLGDDYDSFISYRIRALDYELADEPTDPESLEAFLRMKTDPRSDRNLSYLLENNYRPSKDMSHELELVVGTERAEDYAKEITCSREITVLPGKNYELAVFATNWYNDTDSATLNADIMGETQAFWELDTGSYVLGDPLSFWPFETIPISLTITPDIDPAKVPKGNYTLILALESRTDPSAVSFQSVKLVVPTRQQPLLEAVGQVRKVLDFTEGTKFDFNLVNRGALTDEIHFDVEITPPTGADPGTIDHWSWQIHPYTSYVRLGANKSVPVSLYLRNFRSNQLVPAGVYGISFSARSQANSSRVSTIMVEVEVPEITTNKTRLVSGPGAGELRAGASGYFYFDLFNPSPDQEEFRLEFTVQDSEGQEIASSKDRNGWSCNLYTRSGTDTDWHSVSRDRPILPGFEGAEFRLWLKLHEDTKTGDYQLEIELRNSKSPLFTLSIPAEFSVSGPDIYVEQINYSRYYGKTTIWSKVWLNGTLDDTFTVEILYSKGDLFILLGRETVDFRGQSGTGISATVSFEWDVGLTEDSYGSGTYPVEFRAVVDTENDIIETDEDNNRVERYIRLSAGSGDDDEGDFYINGAVATCGILLLILVVVLAIGMAEKKENQPARHGSRRGKGKDKESSSGDGLAREKEETEKGERSPGKPELPGKKPGPEKTEPPLADSLSVLGSLDSGPLPTSSGPVGQSLDELMGGKTEEQGDEGPTTSGPCPSCGKDTQSSWQTCQWCLHELQPGGGMKQ